MDQVCSFSRPLSRVLMWSISYTAQYAHWSALGATVNLGFIFRRRWMGSMVSLNDRNVKYGIERYECDREFKINHIHDYPPLGDRLPPCSDFREAGTRNVDDQECISRM